MVDDFSQAPTARGARFTRGRWDIWSLGACLIAAAVLLPLVSIAWIAIFPRENIWPHLLATTLPRYAGNSLGLMIFVGLGTAIVGTGTAWLTTMTRFPGRRVFDVLLLTPLAVPAYIGAYAMVDLLEYAGPLQTALREMFGWTRPTDYWFPEVRSFWMAGIVLTFALYPYVYLLARAAFREQSVCALDVSRALGCGPWGSFFRVAVPLARPAIAVGCAIAMMETLNDFGTVDYFAVQTLTLGIFSVWLESYNVGGAAQIACVMMLIVALLILLERRGRAQQRFHHMSRRYQPISKTPLGPIARWAAALACLLPLSIGLILPVTVMIWLAAKRPLILTDDTLWSAAYNTLTLSMAAALIAFIAGLFMVYGARQSYARLPRLLAPLTQLGYAAPGAVIAIGVLIPFAAFDNAVADLILNLTGFDPGLLITGSAAAIVFAYVVRFFAVAYGGIDGALGRVTPSMEMAARSLGRSQASALRDVHLPIITGSALTVTLIVFVDAAKELPATLILRPFNFDTLATLTHTRASLEKVPEAAPAALMIVALGLLPVILLNMAIGRDKRLQDGQPI